MKLHLLIFLLIATNGSFAQNSKPSKSETFEYLRGKLIAFGDGITGVFFNETKCTLTLEYDNGTTIVQYISSLNANAIGWELSNDKKDLTMQIAAKSGLYGDFKREHGKDPEERKFARVLFNTSKVVDDPNFQDKINKAYSRLIEVCNGKGLEKDLFGE